MLRSNLSVLRLWPAFVALFTVGVLAAWLVAAGNPGNMGVCGACFLRDLSGAFGFNAPPKAPRIFRPELVGIVLGALFWRLVTRRFEARTGSFAVTRFALGIVMGVAAMVFLGCPFRMLQRLGGGDLNAWVALPGFIAGVGVARMLERRGYHLGKTQVVTPLLGLVGPLLYVVLLVLFLLGGFLMGPGMSETTGPAHALWSTALIVGVGVGVALSQSGFCAIAAARQVFTGGGRMLAAAALFVLGYALTALISGKANWAFEGQPVAHGDWLWNFLALALLGLCGAFAGGCPVRQIVLTGEGNGDAAVTTGGILIGGALAHNFSMISIASGPAGPGGTTDGGRLFVALAIPLVLLYAYGVMRSAKSTRA
ncbi:MAG: YedE-related selenium metabolism membrane protein [Planctomycetes bacterium]|nr:YedE-related selenium metabolism membrane protein [Planctomycetota bacterium]